MLPPSPPTPKGTVAATAQASAAVGGACCQVIWAGIGVSGAGQQAGRAEPSCPVSATVSAQLPNRQSVITRRLAAWPLTLADALKQQTNRCPFVPFVWFTAAVCSRTNVHLGIFSPTTVCFPLCWSIGPPFISPLLIFDGLAVRGSREPLPWKYPRTHLVRHAFSISPHAHPSWFCHNQRPGGALLKLLSHVWTLGVFYFPPKSFHFLPPGCHSDIPVVPQSLVSPPSGFFPFISVTSLYLDAPPLPPQHFCPLWTCKNSLKRSASSYEPKGPLQENHILGGAGHAWARTAGLLASIVLCAV